MEQTVQKIVSGSELEKIRSSTGMIVFIVKIIEQVHKQKKLSDDDSKKLVSLVIDTLVLVLKERSIEPQLTNDLENNKDYYISLVYEFIDIYHNVSDVCKGCCPKKKEPQIMKSVDAGIGSRSIII
jgi:hypothetical protein